MASSTRLEPLGFIVLLLVSQARAYIWCGSTGNYTIHSTYQSNLEMLLLSITSGPSVSYGFYNLSVGSAQDAASGIGLCRGDVNSVDCRACLNESSTQVTQQCPVQYETFVYKDTCILRYSNRAILGAMEANPTFYGLNVNNVTHIDEFNQVLRTLLDELRARAAAGDSTKKFAKGNASAPDFQTVFAMMQCIPGLSQLLCSDCLVTAMSAMSSRCTGRQGCRVIKPSCNLRFEIYRFYDPSGDGLPLPPPPPPSFPPIPSKPKGRSGNSARTIIMIVIGISGFMLLIVGVFACLRLIRKTPEAPSEGMEEITAESLQYDIGTIRIATDDFSEENKLGQGGFGTVYKGTLADGQDIAVKRLSRSSGQGDVEFRNELLLLAKLQHRNLVRLLGYCLTKSERLLIIEFVPNASLDYYIFDLVKRGELHWEIRYKIIKGIAKGLLYLHEDSRLRVIHRDLKAGNILLDAEMNPKIADFGLARLFPVDQTQNATTKIVGTYGYMAPEYAMNGFFSAKSDVYSFGVLLLEILSGQRSCSFRLQDAVPDLLSFAWKSWREGTISNLIDTTMKGCSITEMSKCIHIGLLCVQENAADRPNMASVLLMLNSSSVTLPLPSRPAVSNPNISEESSWASSLMVYDSKTSNTGGLKSKLVRGSSSSEASISAGELYPR